ncbi:MAG: hypothetical protein ACFFDF_03965 [Candidatus Odinarchaeota archaeon]
MTKQKKSKIYKPGQVWSSPTMFKDKYNKNSKYKKKPSKEDINKIFNEYHIEPSFKEPEIDNTEDMSDILNKLYKEAIQKLRKRLS